MPDGLPQQNRLKPLLVDSDVTWSRFNKQMQWKFERVGQELCFFHLVEVKMGLEVDLKTSNHQEKIKENKKNQIYELNIEAL